MSSYCEGLFTPSEGEIDITKHPMIGLSEPMPTPSSRKFLSQTPEGIFTREVHLDPDGMRGSGGQMRCDDPLYPIALDLLGQCQNVFDEPILVSAIPPISKQ